MAKQNRTILKTYFQQGDIPTQGQYADLIDSQLNLNDGGTQILSGSISASNFVSSAGISLAGTISSSGNLEIGNITSSAGVSIAGKLIAASAVITDITGSNISASLQLITDKIQQGSAAKGVNIIGHITSSGNISSSGTITGDTLVTNNFTPTHITASGNISASGRIVGERVYPNGFSPQPFISTFGGQIQSSEGFTGASITASSNISASGALIGNSLTLGGTAVTSTAAEINFLDGVLSTVKDAYDTAANVSQGIIRFTELDNGTDDLTLTNLSPTGTPSFDGATLTARIEASTYEWDDNTTINQKAFSFITDIPALGPGKSSTVQAITNDTIGVSSVIIGNCNLKLDVVPLNVVDGSFKFMLVNHSSTEAEEVGGECRINFVVL
tara:strand:+ start:234 stop:1391 length:1158 start_codon:yes stop_codon:yes gene_type:complete